MNWKSTDSDFSRTRRQARCLVRTLMSTLALSVFCSIYFGCSTTSVDGNDPATLYLEAEEEIKNDHYLIAVDKLRAVKNKFPQSKQASDAQLRIADVYFMQENYLEAALAYEAFRDLHPLDPRTPYAVFRMAKSYFKDIPSTTARDLGPAFKALNVYQEFLSKYPESLEVEEAKKNLAETRSLLAEKDLSIGNFYFRNGFYISSKPRFEKVIQLYPESESAIQAQERLKTIAERGLTKVEENPKDAKFRP